MALSIRALCPNFAVAPQLAPEDVPEVATRGYATIVNNRPDGEGGSSQPANCDLEQAAKEAGLHYVHLPVVGGAITPEQAQAMRRLLAGAPLPVLAFCRTGARSAQLYALAGGAG